MLLVKLAWKNIWRKKSRTIITMSSIFTAVILAVVTTSMQDGVFDNLVKNVVSFHSGYLQIHKNGYWQEQILDNGMLKDPSLEDTLLQIPGITSISPRLESFALVASEETTKGCLVSGILPVEENQITSLRDKIIDGDYLEADDASILLAEGLAGQLDLKVEDTVVLIGQGYQGAMAVGKYPVKGIIRFGSPELNNQATFLSLQTAQELIGGPDLITTYVLSISSPGKLEEIQSKVETSISDQYEVMNWEEIVPEIAQHIETDKASMYIIIGILYLLIIFGIFGTQLMMMVERKYEMGMLVAIGMTKIKLILATLIESVLTVFLGCLAGMGISVPIVWYLYKNPIRFSGEMAKAYEQFGFEPIFPTSMEVIHFWSQGIIVLGIGLILSLYPIIHILKLDIKEAMSHR